MTVFSHSRLSTFEDCPLKFKYRYIDRIEKPEAQTIEAFVGSIVHRVLQRLYSDLLLEKLNSFEEILALYRALWTAEWRPEIRIVRPGFTAEHYFQYGEKCLRNYYQQYAPFGQAQTLKLEEMLYFQLDEAGHYRLCGVVDRIARRADGTYEIHDYKTSTSLATQQNADSDRQLALYQIALEQLWPDVRTVELCWHYLGYGVTLRSRRTPEQLAELRRSTIEQIDRIEAAREFPPKKSELCGWCEYREECPLWKHVVAVSRLAPEERKLDEGAKLADDYAKAKAEANSAERRVEELREAIIQFARQHGVQTLQGTAHQVAVNFREHRSFPRKGEPAHGELEAWLRSVGRWDEVSTLDPSALNRVLELRTWSAELLQVLERFVTVEESATVRVKSAAEE